MAGPRCAAVGRNSEAYCAASRKPGRWDANAGLRCGWAAYAETLCRPTTPRSAQFVEQLGARIRIGGQAQLDLGGLHRCARLQADDAVDLADVEPPRLQHLLQLAAFGEAQSDRLAVAAPDLRRTR